MKKLTVIALLASMLASSVQAYHYIYLKNSLNPTSFKSPTGQSVQVGPATIKRAVIKDGNGAPPSSDLYDATIDPGQTSYSYSSKSDTWNLTLNIDPSSSNEQELDSSLMRPVLLQQSDDIEVVYLQPTAADPNVYYGYIIYSDGDRFEGPDGTNTGSASDPQPFLQQDGTTKFPAWTAQQAQPTLSAGPATGTSLSQAGVNPFAGMSLLQAETALNSIINTGITDSSLLANYIREFLAQYGIQLAASPNAADQQLYAVLNNELKNL